ncbi:hypothetical protein R1sor_004482 [Riccia sorocarpa]|uniref:Golgi apparatus membrane protein TVP23 homolog n=1 Tax=Riccia sorocarpa TaxID=122646 RepID=A0ABD3HJ18_9MARC
MVLDLNFPPEQKEGDFLFQWDEDHYHEYRYQGLPWLIRIQRLKDNPAVGFISFRDCALGVEIAVPENVRIRDEGLWRDVPRFEPYNYFKIGPFTNYTMLIQNCIPALIIMKLNPPYFSVIRPQPGITSKACGGESLFQGRRLMRTPSFFPLSTGRPLRGIGPYPESLLSRPARETWRAGSPPQSPQYRANYGLAEGITPKPQPYSTHFEQAGRVSPSSQIHTVNHGQPQALQYQQGHTSSYEQAGWTAQNPKPYTAGYAQAGRAPQNLEPYSKNYGEARGSPQNPQLQPANYRQGGGAPQVTKQQLPATGHEAEPAQNPHPQTQNYKNPMTVFFTVFFKGFAIAFYIFCGWFTSSFVIHFVSVSMLMALDFWTIKNVSGRILVGMRWWNDTDEQGQSTWRFESLDQEALTSMSPNDSWLFWWSLYLTCAIWILFGVIAILKFSFDYFLLVCISLSLCSANIIGYTKCRKDAKQRVQAFAQSAISAGMREAMTGTLTRGFQKTLGI